MTYTNKSTELTAWDIRVNDYLHGKYDTDRKTRRTPVEILNEAPRATVVLPAKPNIKMGLDDLLPAPQP